MTHIYFDNASSILYSNKLLNNIEEKEKEINYYSNPHSLNNSSQLTNTKIELIRTKVLKYINADPTIYTCVFTGGTTDSLKKIGEYFNWNINSNYIYTVDNHTSVIGIREYALNKGSNVTVIDFINNNIDELSILFRQESKLNNNNNNNNNNKEKINLFSMPAESNFSGKKYKKEYINLIKEKYGDTLFLYDTAKYASSNNLDISDNIIDFCVLSFYKIFGYPTGLGALIIKKDCIKHLNKNYFGGGTVSVLSTNNDYFISNNHFNSWMEDGSPNYLSIISLEQNLNSKINNDYISKLTYDFYNKIRNYKYSNGNNVFILYDIPLDYNYTKFCKNHGSIITFNILKENGDYFGYKEFEEICVLNNISVRTGCLCNTGACHKNLNINFDDLQSNLLRGHSCSQSIDIIDGKPTGVIRVSFGSMNTINEIDLFLEFININFIKYNFNQNTLNDNTINQNTLNDNTINQNTLNDNTINKNTISVSELNIYPIKSAQKQSVKSWTIEKNGLLYDRQWSIIDNDNKVIRLKKCPNLIYLYPFIDLYSKNLIISYKNNSITIDISINPTELIMQKQCNGYIYNDSINNWLSKHLEINCKLIRSLPDNNYQNVGELLLINESSMNELNNKFNYNYNSNIFRANIIIKGINEYSEDSIESIENNDNKFIFKMKCKRCNMINVDSDTGIIESSEPLLTLSKYRRDKGNIYFGILMNIEYSKEIKVNDIFKVNHQ